MHGFGRAELPQGGPDAEALQRQPAGEEEKLGGEAKPIWHMLSPPPAITQHSLTCWAAALASWLEAKGADKKTFQDVILEYSRHELYRPAERPSFQQRASRLRRVGRRVSKL